MTKEVMKEYNLTPEEASANVNNLAGIEGYQAWALFIESANEVRVRLRSSGVEIESVAKKYNGGGHTMASGARVSCFAEVENLIEDLDEASKKYIRR